ncbi:uncharacterized protein METZ01_LOCUS220825 [marine metagenome]|uniref:Uncharacterized protein n=1 Tax=marine metagenome TaxID=408172 RepID=A0A382G193_9ZZZZ
MIADVFGLPCVVGFAIPGAWVELDLGPVSCGPLSHTLTSCSDAVWMPDQDVAKSDGDGLSIELGLSRSDIAKGADDGEAAHVLLIGERDDS